MRQIEDWLKKLGMPECGADLELGVRPETIEVAANGRELSIETVERMGGDPLACRIAKQNR